MICLYRRASELIVASPGSGGFFFKCLLRVRSAKIIARISELQAQVAEKHEITVDSMIKEFAQTAAEAKAEKQYGPAMTGLTAIAKLAGLWVDRSENLNGNYAISDKPLSEQEWAERSIRRMGGLSRRI